MSDYEYEEEQTKVVYKNNFFGTLITLIIGLILGIVLTVGGVIGAGYWAISQPIGETVNTIDGLAHTSLYTTLFGADDKEGILNDSFATNTVKELIGKVTTAAQALTSDGGSLSALNDISPKVGDALETLAAALNNYAVSLDPQALLEKPLKSSDESVETLPQYLASSIKNMAVGDLFSAFSDGELSELLLALCYGEEGVDFNFDENGKVQMLGNSKKTTLNDLLSGDVIQKLLSMPVDSVLEVSLDDEVMCAIAYGSRDRVYADENGKAQMKQVVYTLNGTAFFDDKGNLVADNCETINSTTMKITLPTGETDENGNAITQTQYVALQDGKWLAFANEELSDPVLYKKVKISDLQGDAMALIDNVYLKDALGITNANNAHKVLVFLAYGDETNYTVAADGTITPTGTPRTIGDLRLRGGDLINDITLSDVVGENREQPLVMYLLYGREGVHYKIDGNNPVQMLQKRIAVLENKAYNEYGETLDGRVNTAEKTYVDGNGVTYKYGDEVIDTVKTADGTANVYYLYNADGSEVQYTKTSLGDMAGSDNLISRLSTRLTIGEIMEIDDNEHSLLKHVKNETIESLPTAIENLTITKVFEKDIYKKDSNGDFLLDTNGKRILDGSWWYLLHNEADCKDNNHNDPSTCDCASDYTIQEMDALIENMKNNIHLSTLEKLSKDGILNFGAGMLNSQIFTEVKAGGITFTINVRVPDENGNFPSDAETPASEAFAGKTKLGELTVEETIEYAEGLILVIEKINNYSNLTP